MKCWNADDADLTDGRGLFFGLLCDYIGFAKAKMDGCGFSLRLKTETEHLPCFKFLEHGF